MELDGILDINDSIHIFVLQSLFLNRMCEDLNQFQQSWNHHKINSENNKSPVQLWELRKNTIPEDAIENIHEYGIYDENDDYNSDDDNNEDDYLLHNQVYVKSRNPFQNNDDFNTFQNNITPFCITDDKLDDSIYEYFTQVVNYCNDLLDFLDY